MMNDPGLKLFVNHLPQTWSESTIYEYFQSYGKISSVEVFKDNIGSIFYKDLGCAYVKFVSKSEAEQTMSKLNHSQSKMSLRWGDGEEERIGLVKASYAEYLTKDGRSYYWNTVTGRTQWNRPHGAYIIPPDQSLQSPELFVFYIPPEWNDQDLFEHFQTFGNIASAKVVLDKDTGKSKGFAFVTYQNSVCAANALQAMNGFQVLGKRLKVQFKKTHE